MEIFEALITRRSIRKYDGKKISDDLIMNILKAAMHAPSAVNKQPWHFIVFRDKHKIEEIIKVHPNASMLREADCAILICWDETLQHDEGYGPIDCSTATQNMLLAAHGFGLGACWVGIYPREKRIYAVHDIFKLPNHIKPFAAVSLGYPAEEKSVQDRFKKERVHFEKWQ